MSKTRIVFCWRPIFGIFVVFIQNVSRAVYIGLKNHFMWKSNISSISTLNTALFHHSWVHYNTITLLYCLTVVFQLSDIIKRVLT